VTEPDAEFRGALRDLIPDYTGPADPMPQIVARVRRRRARRRTLVAVGGTGLAAVLALLGPALLVATRSPAGNPAAYPGQSAPPIAPPSGPVAAPRPDPPVYPVASGEVRGMRWTIGSTSVSAGARRCLRSDGAVFSRDIVCFDGWRADGPVTWASVQASGGTLTVTSIAGVSPGPGVRIRLADGPDRVLLTRRTPTDRAARFFGLVVEGSVAVRDVTVLDAAGRPLGPPVRDPGSPCRPGPSIACADPATPTPTPTPTE
jgi:hypothetical protein